MPGASQQLGDGAHLADLFHLGQEVVERELLPLGRQLGGHLGGLFLAEGLLGLLDQGEHVAHAEDAGRHAVRVERVELVQLLAVGGEHDLAAGDVRDGERGTASGVAVELGEHDTVEADAVAEGLGGVDRVLTDHGVDDEEDLVGADGVADVRGLLHQLLVDAEAAGGVDDHDVVQLGPCVLDRVLRDLDRVTDAVAGCGP